MKQEKLVPELRFPNFQSNWQKFKLDEKVSKVGSGSTPSGGEKAYVDEGVIFVRSQNVNTNQLVFNDVKYIPEAIDLRMANSRIVPLDILLNITGGSIGRSCVVPSSFKRGNLNQHVCIIRLREDNQIFTQTYLSSWYGQRLIYQGMTGSGREGLNFQSIRQFKIPFPSLPEQQKIADFLTSVDHKIQALTRKVELLKDYKKGVMQKIFKQEVRFKKDNGGEFSDWEELRANTLFKNHSNKDHDGSLPILAVTQDEGVVRRDSIGKEIISSIASVKSYKIIEQGDFVISLRSFQGGIEYSNVYGICSPAYTILKPIKDIHEQFYKYYLKKDDFITRLSATVVGIRDGKQISYSAFSGMKLIYPSVKEQTKIASFLTSIDNKISAVEGKLEKMKKWKKGLLQKMFV